MTPRSMRLATAIPCIRETGQKGEWKYILTADVLIPIPAELRPVRSAYGRWWVLEQDADGEWCLRVRKGYAWDGASYAPDFSRGVEGWATVLAVADISGPQAALALCGPLMGSIPHDLMYQCVLEIAETQGLSKWYVLSWADLLFRATMLECGTPARQARIYYLTVAWIGHPLNWLWRNTRWTHLFG